jgi:NADPH:quinone reductase
MKAAVVHQAGGPDVLSFEDVPDPVVTGSDVLIQVHAISIEGGDTLHRAAGPTGDGPLIVGYQCAGTVVQVGERVHGLRVGDRVVSVWPDGSHAELRCVPEAVCWPVPAHLGIEQAACVPIPFGTADDALFEFGQLRAGQTVLVQAGAGGVGIAAIQLAHRAGATVMATASSDEKLRRLSELGLDHGINYRNSDLIGEVRRLTDARGVDLVLDTVGGIVLQDSLRCLAYRGRCISIGDAGRQPATQIDVSGLRGNNQSLIGYYLGAELATGERARTRIAALLERVARGDLRVLIDRRYPLSEAAAAHAYVEGRQAVGRVLLIPTAGAATGPGTT